MPLPTAPYDRRPDSIPLEREEARTALWLAGGNITKAARLLKTSPARLRSFIKNSRYLSAEADEAREQLVDIAEGNVYDALTDEEDASRRDQMSRFVLNSIGRSRGYGTNPGGQVNLNTPKGRLIIEWGDGSSVGDAVQDNNMIDVTPSRDAQNDR